MEFVCSQAELSSALSVVARAVPSRPSHPILASVLIEADPGNGKLSLTGFDLSIGIKTLIPATVKEKGKTAVPLSLLESIVSKLPKDSPISVEVTTEKLKLSTANGSYDIAVQNPEDYPDFPVVKGDNVEIDDKTLSQAIKGVLYSVSTDESKQILQGVCITSGESFEAAATDGHRLSILAVTGKSGQDAPILKVVVPGRPLKELTRLLSEQSGEVVKFAHAKGQAVFEVGSQILTTRLLDGTFPEYRKLIPQSFSTNVTLDRRAFIASLDRVSVLALQHDNVAKVSFSVDRARITADAQDVGSGSEEIAMTLEGAELDIAFNVQYMIDALKSFSTEKILMSCNAATAPFILRPLDGDFEQIALVMPVQIRA